MKLVFDSMTLVKVMGDMANVASQRNILPILSNVLMKADSELMGESKITIAATDLEIGMVMEVEGEVEEPGEITIPAKKLLDIVREAPADSKIMIETLSSDRIGIDYGTAKFKIAGLSSDEFPPVPVVSEGVKIKGDVLCLLLRKVMAGVATEETRYFLNGVYFILATDGTITTVSTDGKRLMTASQATDSVIETQITGIIPSKAVKTIISMFDHDGEITINLLESQLVIGGEGIVFITRLIEGEYPDYNAVIDPVKLNDKVLELNKSDFVSVIKRISLLANPKSPSVRFEVAEGILTATSAIPETGEAVETLPCEYKGESIIAFAVNGKYLLDTIAPIMSKIILKYKEPMSPIMVLDGDDSGYLSIVMPMRS